MGINDSDLGKLASNLSSQGFSGNLTLSLPSIAATQIWDLASSKTNTMELAEAIDSSDLESFGFTDDFIIEVWGIVTDAKSGRLTGSRKSSSEEEDFSYLINAKKGNSRIKS